MGIFAAFIEFSKPIFAAINGPAFGGGVTQATLCDGALSAEQAKFSLPFVSWSVSPEGCCSVHMVRVVGRRAAKKLLVDAWSPEVGAARSIGLASQVVEAEALLTSAQQAIKTLVHGKPTRSFCTITSQPEVF